MPKPPDRVLVFRSGRHLGAALDALRADAPGCEITVVATPAAVRLLDQLGIEARHQIVYDRTPFFQPWPFITSAAGARAFAGRFDRVCVLWNDRDGSGQANVDQTALLISPSGFTAVTADGRLIEHHTARMLARELSRAVASASVAAVLGLCLFLPARLCRPFRA